MIWNTIDNNIGKEGAIALAEMLKHNTCLTTLNLSSTILVFYFKIIIIFVNLLFKTNIYLYFLINSINIYL